MVKRGRKPKEKKGYFYENEENAIVNYITEEDIIKKNKIFNEVIYPALTKMIESIIRRYKLFIPDEDFEENFNDTISYLLTKIANFKPVITGYNLITDTIDNNKTFVLFTENELKNKIRNATDEDPEYIMVYCGEDKNTHESIYNFYKKETHNYKAYSYCGTICKNYLMFKSSQYVKRKKRDIPYESLKDDIINNEFYYIDDDSKASIAETLVSKISNEIKTMLFETHTDTLNENEKKVGNALVSLLTDWENLLPNNGSNKLQKSSVLYYLREETMMTTKEVRDNMKKFKTAYNLIKKGCLSGL